MAVYRNISLSFWTDSKIEDTFSPEDKYMYLYLLTNPHTNICGCYEISMKQISRQTGYNEDMVERILQRMEHSHKVIVYCKETKEMLILNWGRYNWTTSDKLTKPITTAIAGIKHQPFRDYVTVLHENIESIRTVSIPYPYGMDTTVPVSVTDTVTKGDARGKQKTSPLKTERTKYGDYGWVKLTGEEYQRLEKDLGKAELERCIKYIDESAQKTKNKNKWQDWNLVVRHCNRDKWGMKNEGEEPVKWA